MFNKSCPRWMLSLGAVLVISLPHQASAVTPLTKAQIQNLRNIVRLIPQNNSQRPARKADTLTPGDGLSTGRASLAELRFNDGSLARIGEQAIFQFLPKTRDFKLNNGTMLLLIPPGRGQTRVKTPNAAAAIRGSALFVRYNPESDTTIVGALTNSGIQVFNKEASQNYVLQAGQLMVVVKGEFQGLYDFDLKTFYQTSDLVRGLDLTKENQTPTADPDLASVQAETVAALATQASITGEGVVDNPVFLQSPTENVSNLNQTENVSNLNQDVITNSLPDSLTSDSLPVDSFVGTGELIANPSNNPDSNSVGAASPSNSNPETKPPVKDDVHQENKPPQDDDRGKPSDVVQGNQPTQDNDKGKPDQDDDKGKPDQDDDKGKPDKDDDKGKPDKDDVHQQNKPTQDDERGRSEK
ncbi:MAG TPA: FecR family protein [Nostocaceae cyanobacterium]|nr:FecR family protein [Nostocaceae cyanobacterium]